MLATLFKTMHKNSKYLADTVTIYIFGKDKKENMYSEPGWMFFHIRVLGFPIFVITAYIRIFISNLDDIYRSKFKVKVHRGAYHWAIQTTLKFTAYPDKCAQSEIYIYVMSIALMLASNQETSDSRALILNNLNITSTKGSSNILGCKHFIKKSYSGRQSTQLKVNWRTNKEEDSWRKWSQLNF